MPAALAKRIDFFNLAFPRRDVNAHRCIGSIHAHHTTNSVESLNRSLRKIIKTRGGFPNEEAALKLLFLALRQAAKKWTMPIHHWREALNHFTILWPERMPALERVAS